MEGGRWRGEPHLVDDSIHDVNTASNRVADLVAVGRGQFVVEHTTMLARPPQQEARIQMPLHPLPPGPSSRDKQGPSVT